jgi:hypothetical protein
MHLQAAERRCGLAYINKHVGSMWCGVSGNPRTFLLAQTSANYTRVTRSLSVSLSLCYLCHLAGLWPTDRAPVARGTARS